MFVAYAKQKGEGCDYTIGCGNTLWRLESGTRTGAIEELKLKVLGEWFPEYGEFEEGYWNEDALETLILFEITSENIMPLPIWYAEAESRIREAEITAKVAADRQMFEALKAKFGE